MFNINWGELSIQTAIILGIKAFVNNQLVAPQEMLMELALIGISAIATQYIIGYLADTERVNQ